MIDLSKFDSLISLATYFDTESKCKKVLREQRWGKYIVCPHCGSRMYRKIFVSLQSINNKEGGVRLQQGVLSSGFTHTGL